MFTKDQIFTAQAKVKSGADYPNLIQDLKAIGVRSYDHIVSDHSNMFYGDNGHSVVISHSQPSIPVAAEPSSQKLRHSLSIHQQGKTDYPTFCVQAGEAGVSKWVSDLQKMTVTYKGIAGGDILIEPIPVAQQSASADAATKRPRG